MKLFNVQGSCVKRRGPRESRGPLDAERKTLSTLGASK